MERRSVITKDIIDKLEVPASGSRPYMFSEAKAGRNLQAPPGFGVCVTSNNVRSFFLDYRAKQPDGSRKHRRMTIGRYKSQYTIEEAIKKAKELSRDQRDGRDPLAEKRQAQISVETVKNVVNDYIGKHLDTGSLRSATAMSSSLRRFAMETEFGAVPVAELRRSDVVAALDHVKAEAGDGAAATFFAYLRKCLNWYAIRHDDFVSPLIRGMSQNVYNAKAHRRTRILSLEELRRVWAACGELGAFGDIVRLLLLTGQRKAEVTDMPWSELEPGNGFRNWTIPSARYKTKIDHVVPLSGMARDIVERQPRKSGDAGKFVFPNGHGKAFGTCFYPKLKLDKMLVPALPDWRLHDLRRTARTLMARRIAGLPGTPKEIAERVLGHVEDGIVETYDRYDYLDEKREALALLGQKIEAILAGHSE